LLNVTDGASKSISFNTRSEASFFLSGLSYFSQEYASVKLLSTTWKIFDSPFFTNFPNTSALRRRNFSSWLCWN
jgi:hypothetical protein